LLETTDYWLLMEVVVMVDNKACFDYLNIELKEMIAVVVVVVLLKGVSVVAVEVLPSCLTYPTNPDHFEVPS
jgi:hypothetical protein